MKQLFIEQYTKTGEKKVWKLSGDRGQYTFGSSRTADIVSIDQSVELWEGVFEFRNDTWNYVSLNSKSFKADTRPFEFQDSKGEVFFKASHMKLSIISKNVELNRFRIEPVSGTKNAKKFQVYQVCIEDQIVETQILPFSKKYSSRNIPSIQKMEPIPSSSWHVSKYGEFTLKQKTIEVEKPSHLFFMKLEDFIERDSVMGILSVAILSTIFMISYILIPRTETYVPVSKKATARILVTQPELPKKEKNKVAVKDETQKLTAPIEKPKEDGGGDAQPSKNKVAGMLKNLNTGRISSLLSKVSSQGQRSKTVVVSDGVLAGSAPSGRALASLGKIEKSGTDWSQDNGSRGFKISTNGIGGGKNVGNFAALSGGKVGKGGVGLIEEESDVVGGLDREEIASYIRTQLGQILYCYERQLSANKDLFGKVSVKFTISGTGKVETQTVNDTTLKNTTVEGCMLNKIASWKFPAPRGGTKVIVTYPFLFKSTN
ncbi:MAG: AgmX/PglI C-terminal domain-containing protein [Bdellovibrionaceae bacterium]|nr:AgmX/PglI C-terminal domain-containing protein [Pseudobdellovibrionaceae bacterium]